MRSQEVTAQLAHAILADDPIGEFHELVSRWAVSGVGSEAVDPVLRFIEEHPTVDYGTPGPLVHFIEGLGRGAYEGALLDSLKRVPTLCTMWLLQRLLNVTPEDEQRTHLARALRAVAAHPKATLTVKNQARRAVDVLDDDNSQ